MKDFERIDQSLDVNDKLEMAIYHECRRLQKHLKHYEEKDIVLASLYGIMATSLTAILSEKTGRLTCEELDTDNDEFDK
ncbi:MAG: hypothetical protein ACYDAJ_02770 [Nitrosotalea sp.]